MRLLVTGGAGYIGSHCVTELLKAQHEVTVVDNLSTGFKKALETPINQGVTFIQEDIRHIETIKEILRNKKIEGIVHFAAKLIVPESVSHPLDYYDNNVLGSLRLIQACQQTGVSFFVFSSTAAVYGEGTGCALQETDLTRPINPYGASKKMVEQILSDQSFADPNFKFIALRYFNVAGASIEGNNGQRTKGATHLIKVACEVATGQRDSIQIFGTDWLTPDKTCVRDYVHVQDLADAHVVALSALKKGHVGGIYNCGYGRGASVREVISMVEKVSGKKIKTIETARRPGDPELLVSDPRRLKTELLWAPKNDSLEIICKTAYEWELKNSNK